MSSLGGGFSQIRRRSHAQNRITALVREFQRFTASQIKIENPDFRTLNRTTSSRMKYNDQFVYVTRKSVTSQFVMPFEPDFNHTALMLKMDHTGRFSKDASGFGHHGQILGKQELKQGIENGYGPTLYQNFDGETTYIQIKDRYNLLNSSTYVKGFSIACRIYPEDLADNSFDQSKPRTILSKHDDANGLHGYVLAVLPDGALQYTFMRNGIPYSVSTPANTIKLDTTTEADDQLLLGEEISPVVEPIPYDITVATTINTPGVPSQQTIDPLAITQFVGSMPEAIAPGTIMHGAMTDPDGNETGNATTVNTFNTLAVKHIAVCFFSDNWFTGIVFPSTQCSGIRSAGAVPFIRMQTWIQEGDTLADLGTHTHANITAGMFDTQLNAYADACKTFATQLMIEYGVEVNGNWFPWSQEGPTAYKNAYIHIINLFRARGVT